MIPAGLGDRPEFFISKTGKSELAQDTVHHPVGGSGADAVTGACALAVQMIHNSLYQRELYMLGIGNVKLMTAGAVMQRNGLEGKD